MKTDLGLENAQRPTLSHAAKRQSKCGLHYWRTSRVRNAQRSIEGVGRWTLGVERWTFSLLP